MFAREVIEAGGHGVDLGLQGQPLGLVLFLGDEALLRRLLGLELPELQLLLAQSLPGRRRSLLTGLQGALELRLWVGSKSHLGSSSPTSML